VLLGFSAGVTSAALRLATEVVMTQRMSRKMRGAIVAFCTTVGGMTMFVAMMGSNSQFLIESFIKGTASLPAWFSWNPFTAGIGTAAMMNQSPLWWLVGPALAATFGVVAVLLAVQLTQRGLACGLDSVRTAHPVAVVNTPSRRASFGITAWKEMLQMRRQPEFVGQILVTPIIIGLMMYFTGYKNVMEFAVKGGPNIAVAIMIACAYMLMTAGTQMLTSELKMLWLLQCQPRPLADVIRSKARVWAVISIGLAVPFIIGSIVVMPSAAWSILLRTPFLLVALWLLAELIFSLTALAAIVTNEQTIRFRRSAMLPMLVVSNCSLALYNGSWWLQLGALATTVILNAAVRERALVELRWLSEPVDTPPAQVYPMHAILALIGFQTLQGAIGAALSQRPELSVAASMAIAYIGAALVVSACCWDWMRRNGLIGSLVRPRGPALRPIISGLAFSCAAGFAVTMVLRQLSVDSQLPAYATNGNLLHASYDKWCLLVLWVIAAPLFEEWIVRGMMYRSLRRNWGIALSVAVSAVLFATLHPAAGAIALVTLGSMTALAVERTGRLWPSITIHAGYNFMIWMLCAM
jgi:ABC-2 type transport system permease protein